MISLLRWCVRLAGLGALALGVLLWRGMFTGALNVHMALGWIVALVLVIVAAYALNRRVRIPLALISLLWAAATVYVGLRQNQLVTGSGHWVIEILHFLLGVGAIGLAEALGGAITRGTSVVEI
jgi:hypothetical protein